MWHEINQEPTIMSITRKFISKFGSPCQRRKFEVRLFNGHGRCIWNLDGIDKLSSHQKVLSRHNNESPKGPLLISSAEAVLNLHGEQLGLYYVSPLFQISATFTLDLPADSCGGEPDPEPVEVLCCGQELREQGHVEDTPAGTSAEHQQRLEGGESSGTRLRESRA